MLYMLKLKMKIWLNLIDSKNTYLILDLTLNTITISSDFIS